MGVQEPLVDSGKQRILFIDDEPLYLSSLRRVFSGDFDCTTVRYKNSALKLFSEAQASGKPFDAVVTDMRMPGSAWTGCEVANAIKGENGLSKGTPVILLCSNASESDAPEGEPHATYWKLFDAKVGKCGTPSDLIETVRQAIKKARSAANARVEPAGLDKKRMPPARQSSDKQQPKTPLQQATKIG